MRGLWPQPDTLRPLAYDFFRILRRPQQAQQRQAELAKQQAAQALAKQREEAERKQQAEQERQQPKRSRDNDGPGWSR